MSSEGAVARLERELEERLLEAELVVARLYIARGMKILEKYERIPKVKRSKRKRR